MVSRSGALVTSSRAISRASGASSTRWKSSMIRTAPCGGDRWSSRMKGPITASRWRPARLVSASIARRLRGEAPGLVASSGDEVGAGARSSPGRPRRGGTTASAGAFGGRSRRGAWSCRSRRRRGRGRSVVDLLGEPIEQPMARERLLAQRRRLDLRVLDRVAAHVVAMGSAGCWAATALIPGPTGMGTRAHRSIVAGRWCAREPYGSLANWVSTVWSGKAMAVMLTTAAHLSISCASRLVRAARARR